MFGVCLETVLSFFWLIVADGPTDAPVIYVTEGFLLREFVMLDYEFLACIPLVTMLLGEF